MRVGVPTQIIVGLEERNITTLNEMRGAHRRASQARVASAETEEERALKAKAAADARVAAAGEEAEAAVQHEETKALEEQARMMAEAEAKRKAEELAGKSKDIRQFLRTKDS